MNENFRNFSEEDLTRLKNYRDQGMVPRRALSQNHVNWTDPLAPAEAERLLLMMTSAQREFGGEIRAFTDFYLLDELCELRRDLRAARRRREEVE